MLKLGLRGPRVKKVENPWFRPIAPETGVLLTDLATFLLRCNFIMTYSLIPASGGKFGILPLPNCDR